MTVMPTAQQLSQASLKADSNKTRDPRSHNSNEGERMAARARIGASTSGKAASFAGHYGQLILTNGIAPIPKALFLYQGALGLSPQQVWFISYVLSHKWDEE